jgi:formylmethanofuran dehydrogenase subunit C
MLRLHYHSATTIPIEADCICPDQFQHLTTSAIEMLPVQHGNSQAPLAEFFHVSGDAADGQLRIDGDCRRVKLIGSNMKSGSIHIEGNAGMHLGADMCGGEITVEGDAGDWLGAEMRGGRIQVYGRAGNNAGAGYRGARRGMRGGVILIRGDAGSEIGSVMRRGLIAVGGSTGEFLGGSMIAGTIFAFGPVGARPGAGMKRGTLGLFGGRPPLLPTFRPSCVFRPPFLPLYFAKLREWGMPFDPELTRTPLARFSGDLVALGKGEILCKPSER